MSTEHEVSVVRLGAISKHPNADALSLTEVDGRPVILRTGEYAPGDLAVYVPVDTMVPLDDPRFAFLKERNSTADGYSRVKAVRLRGAGAASARSARTRRTRGSPRAAPRRFRVRQVAGHQQRGGAHAAQHARAEGDQVALAAAQKQRRRVSAPRFWRLARSASAPRGRTAPARRAR
jgi:hypothetical protein